MGDVTFRWTQARAADNMTPEQRRIAGLVRFAFATLRFPFDGMEVFHSGRGPEFNNATIDELPGVFEIKHAPSAKGRPYDNSADESTNKIFKAEFTYRERFSTLRELQAKPSDCVNRRNNFRLHSTLGYMSRSSSDWQSWLSEKNVQEGVVNPWPMRRKTRTCRNLSTSTHARRPARPWTSQSIERTGRLLTFQAAMPYCMRTGRIERRPLDKVDKSSLCKWLAVFRDDESSSRASSCE